MKFLQKVLGPSPETSLMGYLTIIVALATAGISILKKGGAIDQADCGIVVAGFTAGIGLIRAKDGNKSNAPSPLKEPQEVKK